MVLLTKGKTPDGRENCVVHRLPQDVVDQTKTGYGMKIVAFGRGGRSAQASTNPISKRYFEFYCISHLTEGRGFHWMQGERLKIFGPGTAVLMTPGTVHCYGGYEDFYTEDTVCFYGPIPDSLKEAGLIKPGLIDFGSERRLLPIIEQVVNPSQLSQLAACMKLQMLLLGLELERKGNLTENGAKARVQSLIEDLKLNPEPWWAVETLPSRCGLGRLQFRRLFTELAGMPPKRYIEGLKMRRAMEMLLRGGDSVAEIGRQLSYTDPFHFSRRFKAFTGMSPADYRHSMRA